MSAYFSPTTHNPLLNPPPYPNPTTSNSDATMRTEFFISLRYLLTKRKEKFISLISVISVLGIAIGVAALIVVIGVMSGFDRDLRDKIVGNYSHITVVGYEGIKSAEAQGILKKLTLIPHITGVSPYLQGQVLLKEGNRYFAVSLKGIEPKSESQVTDVSKYLIQGDLNQIADGIIIGKELAVYFGLQLGSEIIAYSADRKEHRLKVMGIFASGMYEYDMNLVFTDIPKAQDILGLKDTVSAIAVKLDNLYLADAARSRIADEVGPAYVVKTWMEQNKNFFAALNLEKLVMFIILTLIVLVASFNIISTLIVLVVEKTKDIGILKALGMSSAGIQRIFQFQGIIIGTLGTGVGLGLGLFLCAVLKKYQFIKLPQDIYYIDKLPVFIQLWPDVGLIVIAAMAITLIATIYPAYKASAMKPVEALRYE